MLPPPLTRQQSRRIDEIATTRLAIPSVVLMENAGRGVADVLCQLGISGTVVICCGKGNNAGDGFVVARHLKLRGHAVRLLLWANPDELTGDAATNYKIARNCGLPVELFDPTLPHDEKRLSQSLAGAGWIVDALLGTGAYGEPRPPLDKVIDQLNASGIPILAIDLPSGLDCDTGQPASHTVVAKETCTFFSSKIGFSAPSAAKYIGRLHVLDIGVPFLPEIFAEIR